MSYLIGITIGPIFDTIAEATTPGGLWFSSSIFSNITKRICSAIIKEESFKDVSFYSPYFTQDDIDAKSEDGIGKYHDRVIFSVSAYDSNILAKLIDTIKSDTAGYIPAGVKNDTEEFMKEYLQIHYAVIELGGNSNVFTTMSGYLNNLELMRTLPSWNGQNPFVKLFSEEKEDTNKRIKESPLFTEINKASNQLIDEKTRGIRPIEHISGCGEKFTEEKYTRYFAVVSADGDKVGTFIENILMEHVKDFSKGCLDYAKKAASIIGDFGGMTIYAGGDDLLFLAPVIGKDKETVFSLCNRINTEFGEIIKNIDPFKEKTGIIPTISFGISIQYYKYPLYEAFDEAGLLLRKAKKEFGGNGRAISLQKHSGQIISLFVNNSEKDDDCIERIISAGSRDSSSMIQSVMYILRNNDGFFKELNNKAKTGGDREFYINGWENLFDNAGQEYAGDYIREIAGILYDDIITGDSIHAICQENSTDLDTALSVLQLKKFLTEKATEEEKAGEKEGGDK